MGLSRARGAGSRRMADPSLNCLHGLEKREMRAGIPTMSPEDIVIEAEVEDRVPIMSQGELTLVEMEIAEARAMDPGTAHVPI